MDCIHEFSDECEEENKARDSLLRYYSAEVTAHGTYILAVIAAVFAYMQIIQYFPFAGWVHAVVIWVFLAGLFTVLAVLIGRLVFWGYMTTIVLWALPLTAEEFKEWRKRTGSEGTSERCTYLGRLSLACFQRATRYPFWPVRMFARGSFVRMGQIYGILFLSGILTILLVYQPRF